MKTQVLALIPARGGSKGIKLKNLKKLAGRELVRYTIDTALSCAQISKVVVSTDHKMIADICKDAGAEVPFMRPRELANDTSPTIDTVLHAIDYLREQGSDFEVVCLLQPTFPFRAAADLEDALSAFLDSNADSLISVRKVPHKYNPHWTYKKGNHNFLSIATGEKEIISRRQDLPDAYHRDGAIYLTRTAILTSQKSLFGQRILGYEMHSSPDINIDTPEDFRHAEEYIKGKLPVK
jgi:CMP-N-acetylneuraminic acid synthetase